MLASPTTGFSKLYWGESKVYKSASDAIADCLASLAPFLIEPSMKAPSASAT